MAENSKIEWCDHTFNPWEGCTRVSAGCVHCYAEARNDRFGGGNWGPGKPRRRTSDRSWAAPVAWNECAVGTWRCPDCGNIEQSPRGISPGDLMYVCEPCEVKMVPHRPRVFCLSLGDWLDGEVPTEWLADLLKLIVETPNLDWLLLSKRLEAWRQRVYCAWFYWFSRGEIALSHKIEAWISGVPPENVILGTSVENDEQSRRVSELLQIPAKGRFLSIEPMLGPVDFGRVLGDGNNGKHGRNGDNGIGIDWAIFGGESGKGARPCNWRWIEDGVKQCRELGIAPFVKQLGANVIGRNTDGFDGDQGDCWPMGTDTEDLMPARNVCQGDEVRVRLKSKKGGEMEEWPRGLRVREWPRVLGGGGEKRQRAGAVQGASDARGKGALC